MFKHILTATDGSDWANKGLDAAITLAGLMQARLSVLTVSDVYPDYLVTDGYVVPSDAMRLSEAASAHAREVLDMARARAAEKGVMAETLHIMVGPAALAITENAEELGCDLIVIGSRGRRGLTKLLLGSQASEVLSGTSLPVMIIR
jgi:nucleotide-binding universal stress UspA family protein